MTKFGEFDDPWPAPQVLWSDPPWIMSGNHITAWFEVDTFAVSELVSPSFSPMKTARGVPTRLRFYDVYYEPRDGDDRTRANGSGNFREAVIAFKGSMAGVDGEYSAFMWTDDDRYMAWGREVFGWPLLRGDIRLVGPLWDASESGRTVCQLVHPDFNLIIEADEPESLELVERPPPLWLTPRRIIFPSQDGHVRRDLNIVQPTVISAGNSQSHQGSVKLEGRKDSFVSKLQPLGSVRIESLEAFRICVGDQVKTITGHG